MTTTQKIILTSITLLIAASLLYVLTPKSTTTPPPLTQTNFDGSTTQFDKIAFTGREPDLPPSLPPLQTTNSSQSARFLPTIISEYQLQPVEVGIWQSDTATLMADGESDNYILTVTIPTNITQKINLKTAIAAIDQFLNQHGLSTLLRPNISNIQYFSGEFELVSSPASLADFVQIPYSRQFNQVPIIDGQKLGHSMEFLMNGQNEVKRLVFHPFLPDYLPLEEAPLITIPDAIKNINQGQGAIISVSGEETFPDFSHITSGNMQDVALEYRVDGQTKIALPYFHFSGTGTNQAGQTLQLHIITPALTD